MTKFNKITEIIPDDIPQWASEAFQAGNFFKTAIALVEARKWISVEDMMPEIDECVLWYVDSGNIFIEALDKDEDIKDFLTYRARGFMPENVTHWMPLPEPPLK